MKLSDIHKDFVTFVLLGVVIAAFFDKVIL